MKRIACVSVLALCAACKRTAPAPAPTGPTTSPTRLDAGATSPPKPTIAAVLDASSVDVRSVVALRDAARDVAVAPVREVNLVTELGLSLAVSSTVQNARETPWHLVDGDMNTAWNSRTGDLVGAWIAVRIPEGATMKSIRLVNGFASVKNGRDLYLANHRITQVKVLQNGVLLGTFPLDPNNRERQTIPVTGGAGEYRVEVSAVVPGTQSDWREACVSEFEVRGVAPIEMTASIHGPPDVRVGAFTNQGVGPVSRALSNVAILSSQLDLLDDQKSWCKTDEDGDDDVDEDDDAIRGTCYPLDSFNEYRRARSELSNAMAELAHVACRPSPELEKAYSAYLAAAAVVDKLERSQPQVEQPDGYVERGDPAMKKQALPDVVDVSTASPAALDTEIKEQEGEEIGDDESDSVEDERGARDKALARLIAACGITVPSLTILPDPIEYDPTRE